MNSLPDGWKWTNLQDIAKSGLLSDGDWIESKDQDPDGTIRIIQLADLGVGVFLDRSNRYINLETAKRLQCTFLQENDILIARMPEPIGRAMVTPRLRQKAVTVVDVCIVRPANQNINPYWLVNLVNSSDFYYEILRRSTGTTRTRISRINLQKIPIPLPPIWEQRKIAQILSTWDEAIALVEQLIAALQERKRGLMQRLLTGQVRFPGV